MALTDLLTDLKNFKYKQSSPDKIDAQIEKGVDFFPNDDAIGFITDPPTLPSKFNLPSVPKSGGIGVTSNESDSSAETSIAVAAAEGSFFHIVRDGVMDTPWPAAAISYEKDRFSSFNHYEIPIGYDQIMVDPNDTFYSTWENTPQFTSPFMVTPISDYISRYPTDDASLTWGGDPLGTMIGPAFPWPEAAVRYEKTRNVYQHHFLNSPFENIPLDKDLFRPVGGWQYGSINIFDGDVNAPIHDPDEVVGINLYRIGAPTDFSDPSTTLNISAISTTQNLTGTIPANASYNTPKNLGPFTFLDQQIELSTLTSGTRLGEIDTFHLFDDVTGQFANVPAGLNENMALQTKTFREVADPFNVASFRQPFILRPFPEDDGVTGPGNGRWGVDPIEWSGIGGFLGESISEFVAGGGFTRGAPTFTGLLERNIVDKIRLGKFLLTPAGIGFIGRQFAMQALNPTLESKLYNPLSALNIPLGVIGDAAMAASSTVSGLAKLIASVSLPIAHTERHIGEGRYERALLDNDTDLLGIDLSSLILDGSYGRLAYQSKAFSTDIPFISLPPIITGISFFDNWISRTIADVVDTVNAAVAAPFFGPSNPNKYAWPVSSAPKSVKDGRVSFMGTADLALTDVEAAQTKHGGTFNRDTNRQYLPDDTSASTAGLVKRHSTLSYNMLHRHNAYEVSLLSPSERNFDSAFKNNHLLEKREPGNVINTNMGQQGVSYKVDNKDSELGMIKGDAKSLNVDKVNITPYGSSTSAVLGKKGEIPSAAVNDFIKFRFYDVINKKWIIFRAILDGISDAITAEYGEERYIGRPDKVYVYQGADRAVSFNFKIYPKTKQEFPVLMEKLNYLVGLCYPSYTEGERMITPFINLTIGDMFNNTPGLIESLTVTVEDTGTWEIEEGLQFPHYISVGCQFKHIGAYVLASKGKHYDLPWIPDGSSTSRWGGGDLGYKESPKRTNYLGLFDELDQSNT